MSMEVAAVVKATKTSSSSTTSSSSEIITEAAATMSGATRSKRSLTKPSPPVTTSSRGGKKKREADPEIENIAGASATSDAASTPPPSASLTVSSPQVKFDLGGADSQSETTSSSSSSSSSSLSSSTNKKSSAPNNNSTSSAAANSANRNLLKTLNKNPTDSPSSHAVKKQPNLKNIEEEVVVNVDEDTVDCFSIPSNNNNNNSKTKSNHVNNSNHLNHHNNHTHLNNHSNHHAAAKKRTEQNHTKQQEQENNNPREKVLLNGNGEDEEVEVEEEESSSSASQLITKQSSIDVGEETNDANDSSNILAPNATTDAGGEKKVEKKRKQRRSSIHLMNNNLSSLHITSVAQLFVYNWPPSDTTQDENKTFTDEEMEEREKDRLIKVFMSNFNEMFCLQEQFSEYLGVKSFKRKYPDIFRRFIDIKEREYLKDHKVVSETQCDLGLTALNINDCLDLMADDYPEKYKEFSEFLEEKRRRAFADNAIKEKKRLVIALQSQKLLGEELEGETNATNTTTTTTSNSTAPTTTTTVRPQLSESDRMKELIKKAIKSVAKYNSQMQKEISDERRKYFDLQTMRLHCKTNPVKYNCQGGENPSSSPSALKPKTNNRYPVALLAGQFQYHYEKYTPEEKLNLPLTTVMTSRPTPPEILYVEWKKKTDPTTATKNDEPKHKTGYLGTHYSTTPHLSHLATTPSSSHLTSTTTPLTSSASRSLRVKDRTSFKYQSSDDEASNDSKPTNHRSMASPQLTATKTRTASTSSQHSSSSQPQSTIRITASAAPTIAKIISSAHKTCYVCQKPSSLPSSSSSSSLDHNQLLIQCSSCQHASHPNCLELNPQLVDWECIRSYDWQCIECKRCSGCQRTQDEDKMMFCDRCDRGFHTYCVGLGEVPSGSWLCTECSGWQDKLRGLSEKYNERTATTSPLKPPPLPSSPAAVAISPSVQLQLKSKINSTSSVKRLSSATSHVLLDDSISAKRGRGRPKGSLNKVKDGSSPLKKTPKKESLSSPTKITSASFDYSNSNGDFAVGVIGHNEESLSYADYSSSSYADNSTQPQRLQFN